MNFASPQMMIKFENAHQTGYFSPAVDKESEQVVNERYVCINRIGKLCLKLKSLFCEQNGETEQVWQTGKNLLLNDRCYKLNAHENAEKSSSKINSVIMNCAVSQK